MQEKLEQLPCEQFLQGFEKGGRKPRENSKPWRLFLFFSPSNRSWIHVKVARFFLNILLAMVMIFEYVYFFTP